ncbi:uncharacterized protein TRIADDRAFT_18185 [Trichoplax adhaerens]|uniref:Peptidase M20 domain-containing protein 2 n=1 Tax=Trichoplax adhaerens TaxID=10228 RepID=B3RLE3_TRIAD|nr:hypothetical protein TRIADDRAFT_18185 [Trichoplax adhaerens]EDV29529.1 hypothetical protein TRIADDRAFT_18185 [Trichoplax adhaerens]|eukprot:XP_002108731.1 hypothetical protein TRIADDRAFT_18185 [Trichoplax adhaerens]
MSAEELKKVAIQAIDEKNQQLLEINQQLHKNPELAYKEFKSHDLLTNYLEKEGFQVQRSYPLPTSFRATFSRGKGPKMCVICEYDALPEIGHACGHNLIAEAGIGAAIGIKAALETSQTDLGQLIVYGTPAEEGGGGKIKMVEEGCFDDVDIAMMVHPSPYDASYASIYSAMSFKITFEGKAAHAAGSPWEGINALDAAVQAYVNISTLRQQFKPTWRVHGIVTEGGIKTNIIPDRAKLEYRFRAPSDSELQILQQKCKNCFQSAAQATGCKVDIVHEGICGDHYRSVINNLHLVDLYENNAKSLGIEFPSRAEQKQKMLGSTDMGNVSRVVPSIHPTYSIETKGGNHTREFAVAASTEQAHRQTIIAAKSMAMTCIDVMSSRDLQVQIKQEFIASTSQ